MKRSVLYTIGSLLILLFAYTMFAPSSSNVDVPNNQEDIIVKSESVTQTEAEIILQSLSLEQKVGQMLLVGNSNSNSYSELQRMITNLNVGGVMLMRSNVPSEKTVLANLPKLTDAANAIYVDLDLSPRLLIAIDQEGGSTSRIRWSGTDLTPQTAISSATIARRVVGDRAEQLASLGVNVNFSPVIDEISEPKSFLYSRAFRGERDDVINYGQAYIEALQAKGVAATAKHFPGHLDSSEDSHKSLPEVSLTQDEYEVHTEVFKSVIQSSKPDLVMVGHLSFINQDPDFPSSLSKTIISDLRNRLGFDGVVISDDMRMKSITSNFDDSEAAVQAIKAGNDILLYVGNEATVSKAKQAIMAALESGEISEQSINDSVLRILKLKTSLESS